MNSVPSFGDLEELADELLIVTCDEEELFKRQTKAYIETFTNVKHNKEKINDIRQKLIAVVSLQWLIDKYIEKIFSLQKKLECQLVSLENRQNSQEKCYCLERLQMYNTLETILLEMSQLKEGTDYLTEMFTNGQTLEDVHVTVEKIKKIMMHHSTCLDNIEKNMATMTCELNRITTEINLIETNK